MFTTQGTSSPFRNNYSNNNTTFTFGGSTAASPSTSSSTSFNLASTNTTSTSPPASWGAASSSFYGGQQQPQQQPQQQTFQQQQPQHQLGRQQQPGPQFGASSSSSTYPNWTQPGGSTFHHSTFNSNTGSPLVNNHGGGSNPGTPLGGGQPPRRNYLPGYLSGGVASMGQADNRDSPSSTFGQHHLDDSRATNSNNNAWDSPLPGGSSGRGGGGGTDSIIGRKTSMSLNSPSGAGRNHQSLFGNSQRDSSNQTRSPSSFTSRQLPASSLYGGARGTTSTNSNVMDDDAPPTSSLNEFTPEPNNNNNNTNVNSSGSATSPYSTTSLFSNSTTTTTSSSQSPTANSSKSNSNLSSGGPGYAVQIFGFPPTSIDLVLEHFATQFGGTIKTYHLSEEGGNWLTIIFEDPISALRAVRKNGTVLGRVLMIGVKVVDEDELRKALGGVEGVSSLLSGEGTLTTQHASNGSGSRLNGNGNGNNGNNGIPGGKGFGKPVNVLGPNQAFKATPKKTFLSSTTITTTSSATTPTTTTTTLANTRASLFEEKQNNAQAGFGGGDLQRNSNNTGNGGGDGGGGGGGKGVLGKVSDAIFGW